MGWKSWAFIVQLIPQCSVFSRAVMEGKSLSLLFHIWEGSVVDTNDWCIKSGYVSVPSICVIDGFASLPSICAKVAGLLNNVGQYMISPNQFML